MRLKIVGLFCFLQIIAYCGCASNKLRDIATVDDKSKIITCESLFSFNKINSSWSGNTIVDLSSSYSKIDIEEIKKLHPNQNFETRYKILVYSSIPNKDEEDVFKNNPEYLHYYNESNALKRIVAKMREKIILSLPIALRNSWRNKKYNVVVQWTDGKGWLLYDHTFHVHRKEIVGVLAVEGEGMLLKVSNDKSLANLIPEQIIKIADDLPGHVYQAKPGELAITNGVHYRDGGLHAAPQRNEKIPPRFIILLNIDE